MNKPRVTRSEGSSSACLACDAWSQRDSLRENYLVERPPWASPRGEARKGDFDLSDDGTPKILLAVSSSVVMVE